MKQRAMNRGTIVSRNIQFTALCLMALVLAASTGAQGPPRARTAGDPATAAGTVARVGHLRIAYDDLDKAEQEAHKLYRDRNRTEIDPGLVPVVRRQVLENLIRQRLLTLDASRRGMTVSDAEAEAQVRRDPVFQQGGLFNEAKYLAIKAANPTKFAQAMAANRNALAARKAGEQVERETRPDDAAIRAELERELALVSIEYLALRRRSFDGSYPEPRERDVLAHYAAHAERYRRPESVTLGMVVFDRPGLSDSMGATHAGYQAWERRMRGRADSALAAIRAGAKLEDLASRNGGMTKVTMFRDRPADPWRGGPRDVAAAFSAAPGTLLPEPVRAAPGWALVRVEAVTPPHIAPLSEVSAEIRQELRATAKLRSAEALLAEAYAALGDSLRGDGYRVRYGLADTASFTPGEPTTQDLDRYYRAHLADYSTYQRDAGVVAEIPFSQVQDDVRRRWTRDRRRELARLAAERVRESWSRGRRDPVLERSLALVRDLEVVPAAGDADTGRVAAALTTSLAASGGQRGVSVTPVEGGFMVLDLKETMRDVVPTLRQVRMPLLYRVEGRKRLEEEAEARRSFEADPTASRPRPVIHFTRLLFAPTPLLDVPLTHAEVERYYRDHLDDFSVEELVRVRHILIATSGPGSSPDAQARAKAEELLARIRAGENFARLAAEFSDDEATKRDGGDVGVFRRGMMRDAFERAAFAMRPGDITGPVRTTVGYHVLECLEHAPRIARPLVEVYANAAYACAMNKGKRSAVDRADSLYRRLRNVAQAKAAAARLGLPLLATTHEVGATTGFDGELLAYIRKVETLKPGELYPGTQAYRGLGQVITWVDSIAPGGPPRWEAVRDRMTEIFRRGRSLRALTAKRTELDSMSAAGWSFDSLATLWGGLERLQEAEHGSELRAMGGRDVLDSLAFGLRGGRTLETGKVSEWIELPTGSVKLRVAERLAPDPGELAHRVEMRRQRVLWRNLKTYFDRLKNRYPVEILDGELRATPLQEPTES